MKVEHTVLEHLVKVLQVLHDNIAVSLEDSQCKEKMELSTEEVRPEPFPESQHVHPVELSLVPYQDHSEKEEEVGAVGALEMIPQLRVHELNKLVQG